MLEGNYYLTLGVPTNESVAGIRHAFREQVKRYHPDRVGPARASFFYAITEAYRTLSHPERRRDYGRGLSPTMFSAAQSVLSPVGGDVGGLPQVCSSLRFSRVADAFFEAALARASRNLTLARLDDRTFPQARNADVILSAAEALQGGMLDIGVPSCSPCARCGGAARQGLFPWTFATAKACVRKMKIYGSRSRPMSVTALAWRFRCAGWDCIIFIFACAFACTDQAGCLVIDSDVKSLRSGGALWPRRSA